MAKKPSLSARLRELVQIEEKQTEDNGRGGRRDIGWAQIDEVWAEVIPLRGDEALTNGVLRGTQLWKVTIRPRPGVTNKHRLVWGDIVMNIRVGAPNPERDEFVMTCESGGVA